MQLLTMKLNFPASPGMLRNSRKCEHEMQICGEQICAPYKYLHGPDELTYTRE